MTAKILAGGVSFIIVGKGDKKLVGPAITFPFPDSGYAVSPEGRVRPRFPILKDSVTIVGAIPQLKEMKVLNFAGITDSVLSIYNEYGIKAKLKYEGNALVCEMLIPRALLGLDDAATKFAYQIKLTGVKPPPASSGAPPPPMGVPAGRAPLMFNILDEINSVTYFSGEYGLAVKP
ncbi:hypothetical protein [Mucilaginibacter myungsuensis]|uniref:Uncharacterized protein n=1 Tax=Mucilaginibacter myungsuensis TaxID=649104 RepID=A0A929KX96_9SPHI|nr:hypothetical protein [Mucilaginibacter myungsuensis]MBE9661628.1 hypothetical protein [Mucilaginibacter myungsuensis]MDN3597772.1 hypothetical protein [Mucilaginibacter myungsuensis]